MSSFDSDSESTLELKLPVVSWFTSDSSIACIACGDENNEEFINIYFDMKAKCCEYLWYKIKVEDLTDDMNFDELGEFLQGKTVARCTHNLKEDSYGDVNKASFKIEVIDKLGTPYDVYITFGKEHHDRSYSNEYTFNVGSFRDNGSL